MKTESKFLLSLASLFLIMVLFGITYSLAGETIEAYPVPFSFTLAIAFMVLFGSAMYFGFNINKSSN